MKVQYEMIAEKFELLTGAAPVQDDLERVNCPDAGRLGHGHCGWNYKHNCPMYECSDEKKEA